MLVDMPGWAGLGGVRYVPPAWGNTDTDQTKAELNRLNVQLVRTLRTSDAAFSLGEGKICLHPVPNSSLLAKVRSVYIQFPIVLSW